MGGLIGRLFREFAVTVSIAILMSGVDFPDADADDVRPAAAADSATCREDGALAGPLEAAFQRLARTSMTVSLRWALRHQPGHAAADGRDARPPPAISTWSIPKGFFPQQDNGTIPGTTEAAQDISYDAMVRAPARDGQDRDRRSRRADGLLLGRRQPDRQHRPAS